MNIHGSLYMAQAIKWSLANNIKTLKFMFNSKMNVPFIVQKGMIKNLKYMLKA